MAFYLGSGARWSVMLHALFNPLPLHFVVPHKSSDDNELLKSPTCSYKTVVLCILYRWTSLTVQYAASPPLEMSQVVMSQVDVILISHM